MLALRLFWVLVLFNGVISITDAHALGFFNGKTWVYSSPGITVVRGKTFVNVRTVTGVESSFVDIRGTKVIYEHNRVYNLGNIIGRRKASMVSIEKRIPVLPIHQISSKNNLSINYGRIAGY